MTAGDDIIYLPRPALYGVGRIVRVLADGRLKVRLSDDSFEEFDPHELELWSVWQQRKAKAAA